MPSNRLDILDAIREGADRGVLILVVTQCSHGGVSGDYETGQAILETGAISGSDITQVNWKFHLVHYICHQCIFLGSCISQTCTCFIFGYQL